jgi:hypothetical protein
VLPVLDTEDCVDRNSRYKDSSDVQRALVELVSAE